MRGETRGGIPALTVGAAGRVAALPDPRDALLRRARDLLGSARDMLAEDAGEIRGGVGAEREAAAAQAEGAASLIDDWFAAADAVLAAPARCRCLGSDDYCGCEGDIDAYAKKEGGL